MPVHEFALYDRALNESQEPIYDPHSQEYTEVDDDLILEIDDACSNMRTYFHSYNRPQFGLTYYGITIIPSESLATFYEIVTRLYAFHRLEELTELASLIIRAEREGKDLVHFGV